MSTPSNPPPTAPGAIPGKRRLRRSRRRRVLAGALAILAVIALGAAILYVREGRQEKADAANTPRVGETITVDGRSWNLHCTGTASGRSHPTVVLEAGLTESSLTWADLQPLLAGHVRVCSYDRAGYGWSDPATGARTAETIAAELHALLAAGGERGPYLLVGHSLGGLYVRAFAAIYPDETAGLVLIDPTNDDDVIRAGTPWPAILMMRGQQAIVRLGLTRTVASGVLEDAIEPNAPEAIRSRIHFLYRPQAIGTAIDELDASVGSARFVQDHPVRANLPIVVLLADDSWDRDHDHFAGLSSDTTVTRMAGGHYLYYDHPQEVANVILAAAGVTTGTASPASTPAP